MTSPLQKPILHLIPRLPRVENFFLQIAQFDQALDELADNLRLSSGLFSQDVRTVEKYLRFRPERFDYIAQFLAEGRLEIGGWYRYTDYSIEGQIRNLDLGLQALQAFNYSPATLRLNPTWQIFPYLPQILGGFEIQHGIIQPHTGAYPNYIWGIDGIGLRLATAFSPSDELPPARHVLLEYDGLPSQAWDFAETLRRRFPDRDILLNTYQGFSKIPTLPPPTDPTRLPLKGRLVSTESILIQLEQKIATHPSFRQIPLNHPQAIISTLWRDFFDQADLVSDIRYFDSLYPVNIQLPAMIGDFEILAYKARNDGKEGVILRGYNPTDEASRIYLTFEHDWRNCEVVRLDETRTGAKLAMEGQAVQFTAHPHRILTLWLY